MISLVSSKFLAMVNKTLYSVHSAKVVLKAQVYSDAFKGDSDELDFKESTPPYCKFEFSQQSL